MYANFYELFKAENVKQHKLQRKQYFYIFIKFNKNYDKVVHAKNRRTYKYFNQIEFTNQLNEFN